MDDGHVFRPGIGTSGGGPRKLLTTLNLNKF